MLDYYKNALINNNKHNDYSNFLNSLNEEELLAYLYIEAKRSKCYLEEIGLLKNDKEIEPMNMDMHLLKSKEKFDYLLNFINNFSKFGPFSNMVKKNVIKKYNKNIRLLSKGEILFFMES